MSTRNEETAKAMPSQKRSIGSILEPLSELFFPTPRACKRSSNIEKCDTKHCSTQTKAICAHRPGNAVSKKFRDLEVITTNAAFKSSNKMQRHSHDLEFSLRSVPPTAPTECTQTKFESSFERLNCLLKPPHHDEGLYPPTRVESIEKISTRKTSVRRKYGRAFRKESIHVKNKIESNMTLSPPLVTEAVSEGVDAPTGQDEEKRDNPSFRKVLSYEMQVETDPVLKGLPEKEMVEAEKSIVGAEKSNLDRHDCDLRFVRQRNCTLDVTNLFAPLDIAQTIFQQSEGADLMPRTDNGQISGATTHYAEEENVLQTRFFRFMHKHTSLTQIKKIGSGGFAKVYSAIDSQSKLKVAVKRFSACQGFEACMSEARILRRLRACNEDTHDEVEGIVSLTGIGYAPHGGFHIGDEPCLVLKFFQHDDPSSYVRDMTREELREYARALFAALEHVHQQGIVHRDIKPSNFLYNRAARRNLLTDFGLAHECCRAEDWTPEAAIPQAEQKSKRGNRGGTKGYRAPEVLMLSPSQTTAIDMWSAGPYAG